MTGEGFIVLWLVICGVCDARTGEVPNWLTFPALIIGALNAVAGGRETVIVFLGVLGVLMLTYIKGSVGGADVKILAALAGLWPESLVLVTLGIWIWMIGRRLLGYRGSFRAVVPMAAFAWLKWMVAEWIFRSVGV